MNDNSKVIIALLAGLAAGAALGILFAPEKGEETRDRLSESLKNLGDTIKETAAAEIDNLVGLKDKVVESIKTKIKGPEGRPGTRLNITTTIPVAQVATVIALP